MMPVHRDHRRPQTRATATTRGFTRALPFGVLLCCGVCLCLALGFQLAHSAAAQDAVDRPQPQLQRDDPGPSRSDGPQRDRPPTQRRDQEQRERERSAEERRDRNESDERNRLERSDNPRRSGAGRRPAAAARERDRPRETPRGNDAAGSDNRFRSAINGEIMEMLRQLRRDVDQLRDDFYQDRQDRIREDRGEADPPPRAATRLRERARRADNGDRLPPVNPRAGERPAADRFSNNRARTEQAGGQQVRQLQETVQELRQEILRLRRELEQSRDVDSTRDSPRERGLSPADRPTRNRGPGSRSRGRVRPPRETDRPRPERPDPQAERKLPAREPDDAQRPDPPREKERSPQPEPRADLE